MYRRTFKKCLVLCFKRDATRTCTLAAVCGWKHNLAISPARATRPALLSSTVNTHTPSDNYFGSFNSRTHLYNARLEHNARGVHGPVENAFHGRCLPEHVHRHQKEQPHLRRKESRGTIMEGWRIPRYNQHESYTCMVPYHVYQAHTGWKRWNIKK